MKKILVVDDDQVILKYSEMRLAEYEVITESNPENAVKLIRDNTFDLIILDLNMEPINGFTLFKVSKLMCIRAKFILMTSVDTANKLLLKLESDILNNDVSEICRMRNIVKNYGFDNYLPKPHTSDEIREIVKKTIGR